MNKTKEEILDSHFPHTNVSASESSTGYVHYRSTCPRCHFESGIFKAMEQYSLQSTKEKEERVKELEKTLNDARSEIRHLHELYFLSPGKDNGVVLKIESLLNKKS